MIKSLVGIFIGVAFVTGVLLGYAFNHSPHLPAPIASVAAATPPLALVADTDAVDTCSSDPACARKTILQLFGAIEPMLRNYVPDSGIGDPVTVLRIRMKNAVEPLLAPCQTTYDSGRSAEQVADSSLADAQCRVALHFATLRALSVCPPKNSAKTHPLTGDITGTLPTR